MAGKAVLITGASTGIGEACALFLASRGFRVFAGVRKAVDAEKLKSNAMQALTAVFIDVVDRESIAQAHDFIAGALGESGLDGLVNNAGISVSGPVEFVPLDDFRRQFEVNVFGQIAVTQQFLPLLRKAQGRIVNMSSASGRVTAPLLGPYSMSKFALEACSDALRRELRPWGIRVSCIEPGAIATPIWTKALAAIHERTTAMPAHAKQLYGEAMEAFRTAATNMSENAIPSDAVARAVHQALTAKNPQTRYRVGLDAKIQALLIRFLPDYALDGLVRRFLRVD